MSVVEWDLSANKCLKYDIKPAVGKAPALEIWWMWSSSSWLLLSVCSGEEVPDRVLLIGQLEQTVYKKLMMLICDYFIARPYISGIKWPFVVDMP